MVTDITWVALAAGLAVGIPGVLSAIGVGMTGVAAAGVTSEDPTKFSKAFVLEILPGTQGFYGFIAGMLIIIGTGLLGGELKAGIAGLAVLAAAIPAIFQGFTAYAQGLTATAGVSAIAKKPEVFGKCIMYTVMVETYAILGFLATFLLLVSLGVW
ncbi:MAG: V-type ATP synthase subunit K [Candidatus Hodarchaeaceae archaeon]|nr:V-type ATP synthase subunit K [Candidatus Hodarchaeaceae archaeon]